MDVHHPCSLTAHKQNPESQEADAEAEALRPSDLAAGDRGLVGAGGMGVRVGGRSASWPRTAALDETLAPCIYGGREPQDPWQNNARPLWPPRLPSPWSPPDSIHRERERGWAAKMRVTGTK